VDDERTPWAKRRSEQRKWDAELQKRVLPSARGQQPNGRAADEQHHYSSRRRHGAWRSPWPCR